MSSAGVLQSQSCYSSCSAYKAHSQFCPSQFETFSPLQSFPFCSTFTQSHFTQFFCTRSLLLPQKQKSKRKEEGQKKRRRNMATNQVLTDDDKRMFIRDGYFVLRGAIPEDMVQAALNIVDEAYNTGNYSFDESKFDPVPNFPIELQRHPDIGKILDRTNVFAAMEDLLGKGNVKYNRAPQIAFRTTDKKQVQNGFGMNDLIPWFRYHIDGGSGTLASTGSPFTLLVGVCLSPGQDVDENRGQFTTWPGSHFKLHKVVRQRWKDDLIKGHQIFGGHGIHKPRIGKPVRVLANPGDVVLAHQRLGHAGGINIHENPRKNLYFRVHHQKHAEMVYDMLEGSVFTEYEGLLHLKDDIAQAEADAEAADEADN